MMTLSHAVVDVLLNYTSRSRRSSALVAAAVNAGPVAIEEQD